MFSPVIKLDQSYIIILNVNLLYIYKNLKSYFLESTEIMTTLASLQYKLVKTDSRNLHKQCYEYIIRKKSFITIPFHKSLKF